jgi:hypothetical protein
VAQGEGPEFKPQYLKKKKKTNQTNIKTKNQKPKTKKQEALFLMVPLPFSSAIPAVFHILFCAVTLPFSQVEDPEVCRTTMQFHICASHKCYFFCQEYPSPYSTWQKPTSSSNSVPGPSPDLVCLLLPKLPAPRPPPRLSCAHLQRPYQTAQELVAVLSPPL